MLGVGFPFLSRKPPGGALPAPVVSAVETQYAGGFACVVDPTVGTPIAVYGSGFVNGATITINGAPCTGVTFSSSSLLLATSPAGLGAGTYDLVVTNPDTQTSGASGNGLVEAWGAITDAPALLLLPGDFSNPTPGTPSTATWTDSSGNGYNAVAYSTNPADDGNGCPLFAADSALNIAASLCDDTSYPGASLATVTAGTVVVIDVPNVVEVNGGAYYNGATISGNGATPGMASTDVGIRVWGYDGTTYVEADTVGIPVVSTPEIGFMKWTADTLSVRKDGEAYVDAAMSGTLSVGNIGSITYVGSSYSYGYLYDGVIRLVAVYASTKDAAWSTRFRTWAIGRGWLT